MNDTQRDAWELVMAAIRATDGVFLRLSRRVGALIRTFARLTLSERPSLMRQIDRLLDAAFGLTKRGALTSELFLTIVRATDPAIERPALRLLERIGRIIGRRDPLLWQRVEPRLRADLGLGPRVWSLDTTGLSDPRRWQQAATALRQAAAPTQMARSRLLDPQRKWLPREKWNTKTGYRLSDRVWRQGRIIRRNIDAEIRAAIRRGDGPATLARNLEDYLNPELAPTRFLRNGRIVRRFTTSKPTGAGHGSTYARTLARTETMRIHHAATMQAARVVPGVIGLKWNVSGSHPRPDECDDKAHDSSRGMGPGEYTVDEFPMMPSHPNCLCISTYVMKSADEVIEDIIRMYS